MPNKDTFHAFVIVPIYNIKVDKTLLDQVLADGFSLISKQHLKKEYFEFIKKNTPVEILNLLNADLFVPDNQLLITRPFANYVLFKRTRIEKDLDKEEHKNIIMTIGNTINYIMLSLRLIQSGRCQINKCYILGEWFQSSFNLQCSSYLECLNTFRFLHKDFIEEEPYIINDKTFNQIKSLYNKTKRLYSNILNIPLDYFNQYYNAFGIFDRIIKLAIILESILLSGDNQELKYRLSIRACNILQKDVFDEFKAFYDIRSAIVHEGNLSDRECKKLIKFLPQYSNLEFNANVRSKVLFDFVNNIIAQLVREILLKSIELITKDNINSLKNLNKFIDNNIVRNISVNIENMKKEVADAK